MRASGLLIAAVVALSACGGNNGTNNGTNNGEGTNNQTTSTNNDTTEVDNSGAEYADEYELKFDTLAFGNPPAQSLNGLVATNLRETQEYPIVVLLELFDFDFEAGTATLVGGSGLKTDEAGVYVFDAESSPEPVETTFDAETGSFEAFDDYFGFIATFKFEDEVTKTLLPIENLTIEGKLALDEGGATATIVDGYLEGILTKESGDNTMIALTPGSAPVSITQIFKETSLNFDTETNAMVDSGEGDAWFITATYTATTVDIED